MQLLFHFLSYRYGHPPRQYLHSFPTRRSSDLIPALGDAAVIESWARTGRPWHLQIDTDRKSTRLNSSHLGISYAVFCLKKKIIRSCYHMGFGKTVPGLSLNSTPLRYGRLGGHA